METSASKKKDFLSASDTFVCCFYSGIRFQYINFQQFVIRQLLEHIIYPLFEHVSQIQLEKSKQITHIDAFLQCIMSRCLPTKPNPHSVIIYDSLELLGVVASLCHTLTYHLQEKAKASLPYV